MRHSKSAAGSDNQSVDQKDNRPNNQKNEQEQTVKSNDPDTGKQATDQSYSQSKMSTRTPVLGLYRALQRTQRRTFENDHPMQIRAAAEIRNHFNKNRRLTDEKQIQDAMKSAQDANEYLKTSVIQAKKKSDGNYVAEIRPEQTVKDT